MWRCSDELRDRADEVHRSSKKSAKHYIGNMDIALVLSNFGPICILVNQLIILKEKT
jgi:hypothetical protein